MSRGRLSLDSVLDVGLVDRPPDLCAVVSQEDIDHAIEDLEGKCPGFAFDKPSVVGRHRFVGRVEDQITRAEAQIKLWQRKRQDCLAIKPYDMAMWKLYREQQVNEALENNACAPRSKRAREEAWQDRLPHIDYVDDEAGHDGSDDSVGSLDGHMAGAQLQGGERRPTHAHGGERIGEASNPGPPESQEAKVLGLATLTLKTKSAEEQDAVIGFTLMRHRFPDRSQRVALLEAQLKKEKAEAKGSLFCLVCSKKHHPCLATPVANRKYLQCVKCAGVCCGPCDGDCNRVSGIMSEQLEDGSWVPGANRQCRACRAAPALPLLTVEAEAEESAAESEPELTWGKAKRAQGIMATTTGTPYDSEFEEEPNECEKCGWTSYRYSTMHESPASDRLLCPRCLPEDHPEYEPEAESESESGEEDECSDCHKPFRHASHGMWGYCHGYGYCFDCWGDKHQDYCTRPDCPFLQADSDEEEPAMPDALPDASTRAA